MIFKTKSEYIDWLEEEERWLNINPILNISNKYMISSYGKIKNIETGFEYESEYHSSNGFDFTLVEMCDGNLRYFPMDMIVGVTFWCHNSDKNLINKKVIPEHIDNNLRNNNASNISFVELKEIWKPIVHSNIKKGLYKVSNLGNIKNLRKGFTCIISKNPKHYPKVKLLCNDQKLRSFDVHRLVASAFVKRDNPKQNIVNHIDCNKTNNCWKNLEWVTFSENNRHAFITIHEKRISTKDIDMIRFLIKKYKRPSVVYKHINHDLYPLITIEIITSIKNGKCYNRSECFSQEELNRFKNENRCCGHFSKDDICRFCEVLVENEGDLKLSHETLIDEGYFYLELLFMILKIKDIGLIYPITTSLKIILIDQHDIS